jgi:threonine/homoserine/homoserine lactone efflux protein
MLDPLLSGIGFGLILAVILGPVFFTLLQTALHEGFKAGAHFAYGVFLSDAAWIIVAYSFASQLDLTGKYRTAVGWIGGVLMIMFGIMTLIKKIKSREVDDNKKTVHAKYVLKAFVLNTFNPAVPLFWIGVLSVVKLQETYSKAHEAVFFLSVLSTAFLCDLGKSYVAQRIKNLLKPGVVHWLNRILGIILIGVGVRMIVKVL